MSIIDDINSRIGGICKCGKHHEKITLSVECGKGKVNTVGKYAKSFNAKMAFVLADENTYKAAGEAVEKVLENDGLSFVTYIYKAEPGKLLEPYEYSFGSALMNFKPDCDIVIAVGSGVINDIGKVLANCVKLPYIIVGTAPSMDGYASATSSVFMDGIKVSLPCKLPDVIIGDTDIFKNAPSRMLTSGLGDMLAKYLSILEWRISNVVTEEYYCEVVAQIIRDALSKCVKNLDGLLKREEQAVEAVFEGLVASGLGMKLAGLSRPASGIEHSVSHIWDMRGLEFRTPIDFHGIQCAIGTLIGFRVFEQIRSFKPDREKALEYARSFDVEKHNRMLRRFIGKGAVGMIEAEKRDGKYRAENHERRLSRILENYDRIMEMIDRELPFDSSELETLLRKIECPTRPSEIGIPDDELEDTFSATMDIRDKYVLSRFCWDIGMTVNLL